MVNIHIYISVAIKLSRNKTKKSISDNSTDNISKCLWVSQPFRFTSRSPNPNSKYFQLFLSIFMNTGHPDPPPMQSTLYNNILKARRDFKDTNFHMCSFTSKKQFKTQMVGGLLRGITVSKKLPLKITLSPLRGATTRLYIQQVDLVKQNPVT